MASDLSKKLIELKERLEKIKGLADYKANKAAKKLVDRVRRRNNTQTQLPKLSEKEHKEKTAQKEIESKLSSDKSFKEAALRSNQAAKKAKEEKAHQTAVQNIGYDKAVNDEKNVPETVGTKKRGDKYINQMNRRKDAGVNKLIDKRSRMGKSIKERLEEFKKGMQNAGLGGAGSVKAGAVLPSINKLPKPGNNSLAGKTGIPGMKQESVKNPLKVAEQIQNKDIKDVKMKEAQAALKAPQMAKEDFPFKNAHSHEEKAKQLNQAYDKHKSLYDKAPSPVDKQYHLGNLNRIHAKIQEHAGFKKKEELEFNKSGQWSLKKDSADPKFAPKDRKVKELQAQIDAGTYKPDASKIADKMLPHLEKPLKKSEEDLEKAAKVIELNPDYNAQVKHNKRQEAKSQGKDPLHQPAKDFKHIERSSGAELTGGKKGWYAKDKGISEAGAHTRSHDANSPEQFLEAGRAKSKHKEVLANLKKQPKPNLTKQEIIKANSGGQWSLSKALSAASGEGGTQITSDLPKSISNLATGHAPGTPQWRHYVDKAHEWHDKVHNAIMKDNPHLEHSFGEGLSTRTHGYTGKIKSINALKELHAKHGAEFDVQHYTDEHDDDDTTEKTEKVKIELKKNGQWSIEKSNYKDYKEADNVKRKANNLGEETGIKGMPRIKEYGGHGPSAASRAATEAKKASAKNEVKWTHKHPETGESVTVSMTPRKLKNYQDKIKALANKKGN